MKKLLGIMVLGLLLTLSAKADDIRDFEIEGISIGDSLLDYYTKNEIVSKKVNYYKDNTFSSINIYNDDLKINLKIYEQVVVGFKSNDKNYTLAAISGILVLDIDDCFNRIKLITKEISDIFPNTKPTNKKNIQVTFGKHTYNKFELNDGDNVKVSCVDYDSTNEYPDHLRIAINNGDYQDWLNEKAYK